MKIYIIRFAFFFIAATSFACAIGAQPQTPGDAVSPAIPLTEKDGSKDKRDLTFPKDKSIGKLKAYDRAAAKWIELGEARGKVSVPKNAAVVLALNGDGARDLSPLKSLPADALQQLVLDGLKIEDGQFANLQGLTGLKKVSLRGCEITDGAMEHIGAMASLEELDLALTALTDEGVEKLTKLQNLSYLDLSSTKITKKSVDAIIQLKALTYLDPEKTGIDADAVMKIKEALPQCSVMER